MNRAICVTAAFLLLAIWSAPMTAQSDPTTTTGILPPAVEAAVREMYVGRNGEIRYFAAAINLNVEGYPEIIVHVVGDTVCGSGGWCDTLVFTPNGTAFRHVATIRSTRPPIRVSPVRSHDWRNLIVTCREATGDHATSNCATTGRRIRPTRQPRRPIATRASLPKSPFLRIAHSTAARCWRCGSAHALACAIVPSSPRRLKRAPLVTRPSKPPGHSRCGALPARSVFQILFQEVIEERANHGDRAKPPYLVPGRRNDAADDVGGELELQTEEQPHSQSAPERLALAVGDPRVDDNPPKFYKRFYGAVRDDDHGGRFDEHRRGARERDEQIFHVTSSMPPLARCSGSRGDKSMYRLVRGSAPPADSGGSSSGRTNVSRP